MQSSDRLTLEEIQQLEELAARKLPKNPTWGEQSLTDRVRRCFSWLKTATESSSENGPQRFMELWIGLNTLYGTRPYEVGRNKDERSDFERFLHLLSRLGAASEEFVNVMKRSEKRSVGLIRNKYLWNEFWREDGIGYREKSAIAHREIEQAIHAKDVVTYYALIFERLRVLRNQIAHGSSSVDTRKSADALVPALLFLEETIPLFLRLMIQHCIGREWLPVPYPGRETPQHPE